MAVAVPLSSREIEQVGDLLGVDAEHRRVFHPVGPGHHAKHPFRRRHRADGQVGGHTLRGLLRLRHLHARPVAEELQRVACHRVERLDAALVQRGQCRGGMPVMAPLACRSIVGGHQTEQSHNRQRDERHDQLRGRRRRAVARGAGRRRPFPSAEGCPPLIAALHRLAVVRWASRSQAAVVAVGKPEKRAAKVGEHAPQGEHAGDVGDQPAGILDNLQTGHLATLAVGKIDL